MADVLQTHPYTCNSCAVAFRNSDAQRTHMRSDWHRYNLKRKVADLPPVSSDDFNQKVITAQASTTAAKEQASYTKSCTICRKTYYSENAFQSHISSKAHRQRASAAGAKSPSLAPSRDTNGEEPISPEAEAEFEDVVAGMKKTNLVDDVVPRRTFAPPPGVDRAEHPLSPPKVVPTTASASRCLFCNYDSPTVKLSVDHMTKIHGLFVPEQNYLVDLEGLVSYLQAKIHENHECISCHKLKNSAAAVQTHMRDKGHCMIAFEEEEEMIEIGQFYDFSSTYSDEEEDMSEADGAKVDGEDAGWETDSDVSSVASEEITAIPNDDRTDAYQRMKLNRHHSNTVERPHKNIDGFHSHAHNHNNAVFYDEHEMHLPSGRIAGHRSMNKYYRQNLHNYPSQAERMARTQQLLRDGPPTTSDEDSDEEMQDVEGQITPPTPPKSQSLMRRGEAGMLGVTEVKKQQVKKAEQKSRTRAQRDQNRYQARLEKQNNSQKHFRDPLLQ
ncbi:pre-60S factor rei1 [Lithohypha guttulata]|uniref:pre-60S factor rei1 n=1 Tax=Lithohypha guttulata TaxID=1690604 RepID=UPI002DDE7EDD|nr:pre-60S factor rei1 [Lithohypha guttulata]